MIRKVILLSILAVFPLFSCTVSKYNASNQRNHISKPALKPPRKGGPGQSRCLVTMIEKASFDYQILYIGYQPLN